MVGALAGYNLNHSKLTSLGKKVAGKFGFKALCFNLFMNTVAQLVEIAHCFQDSINIIDKLLDGDLSKEKIEVGVKAGCGIGVVEALGGIFFHDYMINKQNHEDIQKGMEAFAPALP